MNTKKNKGYGTLNLISVIAVITALAFTALSLAGCPTEEHVHDWGEWSVTTPATCTTEGVETRTCKSDGTTETRTLAIDPNAHDWDEWKDITKAATCIETGLGKRICKLNSEHTETVIPVDLVNGHDWDDDWAEESEPTETVNGAEARSCKRDSTHKDHRPLWATGSAGLRFPSFYIDGERYYYVVKGTFAGTTLHIPAYYRDSLTDYNDYRLVTKIHASEFKDDTDITAVTFAVESKLTTIEQEAFSGCSSLASITLPDSVTTIGEWAFHECTSLASINIPDSVTSIGKLAFNGCTSLASITIGSGVTEIGELTFTRCDSLTSITVDPANQHFRSQDGILYSATAIVFIPSGISGSITIPDGITTIGEWAFADRTNITSVTIGAGVTSIGERAFGNCTSLTSVTLPASLTTIGKSAFSFCTSLTGITIPAGVTEIGENAFGNCTSLTSVTIPASLTTIGRSAFSFCTSLTSITIPEGVTSIGSDAFTNCSGLTSITVDPANQHFKSQDSILYNNPTTAIIFVPQKISGSITIPNGITTIGDRTFAYCSNLTSITIPASVTSIGRSVFIGWTAAQTINVAGHANKAAADAAWGADWLAYFAYTGDPETTPPTRYEVPSIIKYAGEF